MTARALPEDTQPNVRPRSLVFAGGVCDLSEMPAAHPNGTPTTYTEPSRDARVTAFLELARVNIAESLDTASAFERKFSIQAAQVCVQAALELLK